MHKPLNSFRSPEPKLKGQAFLTLVSSKHLNLNFKTCSPCFATMQESNA
jgi:hypothetical protein